MPVPAKKSRSARSARPVSGRSSSRVERWVVDDYLSYLLARASHVVSSAFHLDVRAAGLTVLEWRVLATLADGRAYSVGQLASIALAQQSTVTKLLGRLEAEGRVARSEATHDRRQSMVRLTADGRAALGTLPQRAKSHEKRSVAGLDAAETKALKSALRKLIGER